MTRVLAWASILGNLAEHPTIARLDHPKLIEGLELAELSLEECLENLSPLDSRNLPELSTSHNLQLKTRIWEHPLSL